MYIPRPYPGRPGSRGQSRGLRRTEQRAATPATLGGLPLDAERREALALKNKRVMDVAKRRAIDDDNRSKERPSTSAGVSGPRRRHLDGGGAIEESPRGNRPSSAAPAVGNLRRVKEKPPLDTGMTGLRLRNQTRASSAGLRTAHVAAGIRFPTPVLQGRKGRETPDMGVSDYWRFLNHRRDVIENQVARLQHKIDNDRLREAAMRAQTPRPNKGGSSSRPPSVVGSRLRRRFDSPIRAYDKDTTVVGLANDNDDKKTLAKPGDVQRPSTPSVTDEAEEERPVSPRGDSEAPGKGVTTKLPKQHSTAAGPPIPAELKSLVLKAQACDRPATSPAVHGGQIHVADDELDGGERRHHRTGKGKLGTNLEEYQLGRSVGQGAYATVRLAHHMPTNCNVAVKVYDKVKLLDPQKRKGVKREMKLLERMSHPNIVRFHDALDSTRHILIVTEYVGGGSLHALLKRRPGRRLDETTAGRIFLQVAQGVKYMHDRCIIHRWDGASSEAVMMVQANGEHPSADCTYQLPGPQIKIIDFGFSTILPPGKKLKVFCGTPSYMAPEIVQKREYHGSCADIWALGILLHAFLAGCFPFKGPTDKELYKKIARGVFQVPSHISERAQTLLCRLLRREADKRPLIHDVVHSDWLQHLLGDDLDEEDSSSLLCTSGGMETNASTCATGGGLGGSTTTWTPTRKRAKSEERVLYRDVALAVPPPSIPRPSTSNRQQRPRAPPSNSAYEEDAISKLERLGYSRDEILSQIRDEKSHLSKLYQRFLQTVV
ncbi:hypothetical protein FOL47_001411 [Perkinsus chesapeaki]|uniref:Protein kinase domain-containing protein n=1 Tax=Perkinsus chesapeaki TaxID=330153 RepID=A0A7J6MJI0_PERCH|nr:hypothetical protein FOL47_001411 [Perkinsus chesapeaki]